MSVDATHLYNAGTQFTCFTSAKVQILTGLCNSAPYLHLFWSAPFQLCVATFLLYRYPDVSWRILTYPHVCFSSTECWALLSSGSVIINKIQLKTKAHSDDSPSSTDVCWRMLTNADVCWRMLVLYRVLGVAIFGGLILMVVLLPVNTWIAQKQQVLSLLAFLVQMSRNEQRVVNLLALLVVLIPANTWIAQKQQVCVCVWKLVQQHKYWRRS